MLGDRDDPAAIRVHGAVDLATIQRYLNFWFTSSLDLFGSEGREAATGRGVMFVLAEALAESGKLPGLRDALYEDGVLVTENAQAAFPLMVQHVLPTGVRGIVVAAELLAQCGTPVTIPGYVPRPARMKPRLRPLTEAVRNGDEVTLLYGGSDTGIPSSLHVLPRLLYERHKKSYLEAECSRTGLLKTYLLDRIQKVVSESA